MFGARLGFLPSSFQSRHIGLQDDYGIGNLTALSKLLLNKVRAEVLMANELLFFELSYVV